MRTPRTILITGGSSGIGLELVRKYWQEAYEPKEHNLRLLVVGLESFQEMTSKDKEIQRIFTSKAVAYLKLDFAQLGFIKVLDRWLNHLKVSIIDLVIHCAGTGWYGDHFWDQTTESILTIFHVNLVAPLLLTHHLLKRNAFTPRLIYFIFL
jgi:short-subunit dehydrogenase